MPSSHSKADVTKLAVHILTEEVPRHVTCIDHPEDCTCSLSASPDHSHCCDIPTTATTTPITVAGTTTPPPTTATTTTTTTTTPPPTTTTSAAPAQPQCSCDQCVTCDDTPTCGLGVSNAGFEDDGIPTDFTYIRTTPKGWQFDSTAGAVGVSKYEKVVVSTTDGRFHRVTGQAVYLLSGALRQTTEVYPKESHDYVLTIRVVLDGANYASDGVELRLEAGGAVLADKYFSRAEINGKTGPGSSVQIVALEVQFSARKNIPHPIEIVIDTLGNVVAESRAALFDDVRLCERSNACTPTYPRCDVAKTDYVALIDMSGSIDHAIVATEHAVTGVIGLYNATKLLPTGTAQVRVAAYAFAKGDLQAETGPTALSTAADLAQVVAGIRAMLGRRRPGQPTAIGAAMVGLANKAWFQSFAHVKIVALYSDGDPDRLENDAAFTQRLGVFTSSMPSSDDAVVCLYSAQPSGATLRAPGVARLRAFHRYSSTSGCRWNVDDTAADPVTDWWDRKQADWTADAAALYENTLRSVVVPRQPCAASPPDCSCDFIGVATALDECCDDVCYPDTTFTTTGTTSMTSTPTTTATTTTPTSTPTTTFTSTPSTTETTQLQHCECDECIACDSIMKCDADTVSGLTNGNFEDGHATSGTSGGGAGLHTVVGVPAGWTVMQGPLNQALVQHADKFFGSTEYDTDESSGGSKHAGYIAQGGLTQASSLMVKENQEYSLRLKLVIDRKHSFSGCKVSLRDGSGVNADVLAEGEYPATLYTSAQLRAGVDVEIGFTARADGAARINIVIERLYVGNTFGESELVMFDDVALCMQSNQCNPIYPACSTMDVNFLAMVDVSGSIQRKQAMLRQAVETIAAVHEASKLYMPVSPRVHAAMYVFQKGEAVQVWPPAITPSDGSASRPAPSSRLTDSVVRDLNATFDDFWVLQHVGELYALNGGTTIAKAMASLRMVASDGDTLFPYRASLGSVALFSDGDAFQTIENDDAFNRGMAEFRDNTDWISKETCLYAVYQQGYSGPMNLARLQRFGTFSAPACISTSSGAGSTLRTFSAGAAATATMFSVDVPRHQQCLQGPAHGNCQCEQAVADLGRCCEDMCYPETTFTTTATTSTTPTSTLTTTPTTTTPTTTLTTTPTTTPTTTILPQCSCNECIECDRKPDCSFVEVLNKEFEFDRIPDGQLIDGEVPEGWDLVDGLGSATVRRSSTSASATAVTSSGQELFLSAGTLVQVLNRGSVVRLPQAGETYVLSATVSVEAGHIFQGGTISLMSGTQVLASRTLERGYIGSSGSGGGSSVAEARMEANIEVSATPSQDLAEPFAIALDVLQSDSMQDMTLFDNIQLCKRTNECNPRYPQCQRADINLVLLVDVSGSIGNVQGSLVKATGIVDSLYNKMHSDPPPPGIDRDQISQIKISVFIFHKGAAECILLREPLVNSSQAIVMQRVALSAQNVPLNAATTIGEAVKSLTVLTEFGALWREGADMTTIILVSDGDPDKETESTQQFNSYMQQFKNYVDTRCADKYWLCDSGDQCISQNRVCDANAFIDCEDGSDESERHCAALAGTQSTAVAGGGRGGGGARSVSTATSAPISAGATSIAVSDVTGVSINDTFAITDGVNSESSTVTSVTVGGGGRRTRRAVPGSVTIAEPLAYSYTAGGATVTFTAPSRPSGAEAPDNAVAVCGDTEWTCRGGTIACIQSYFLCDQYTDCSDSSDEEATMCAALGLSNSAEADPLLAVCRARGSQVHMCGKGDPSGPPCIPKALTCDGVLDCGDGSDESATTCPPRPATTAVPTTAAATTVPAQDRFCQQRSSPVFMCATSVSVFSSLPCIPGTFLCDGISDCMDGSDEAPAVCTPESGGTGATAGDAVEGAGAASDAAGADNGGGAPAAATTTAAPNVTAAWTTCTGKVSSKGEACWCGNDCHECSMLDGIMKNCKVCKNSKFLFNRRCLGDETDCTKWTSVHGTFVVTGTGNFNRKCSRRFEEETICTGRSSSQGLECWCGGDCHTCEYVHGDFWGTMPPVAGECKSCKNGMALHEGECITVDECSAMPRQISGKGRFGLVCEEPNEIISAITASQSVVCTGKVAVVAEGAGGTETCWCGGSCHKCRYNVRGSNGAKEGKVCTMCKNGKVLLDSGECALRAKCAGTVNGVGKFGLTCSAVADGDGGGGGVLGGGGGGMLVCDGTALVGSGGDCSCDMLVHPSGAMLSGCTTCSFNIDGSGARCINCKALLFASAAGGCVSADQCLALEGSPSIEDGTFVRTCTPP